MFDCTLIHNDTGEDILKISNIPEIHVDAVLELADDCCCRTDTTGWAPHIFAYGSSESIQLLKLEILGIFARMQHLDNCYQKS